ncbi:PD-(D/E)XK nuclease family protein [Joostella sp. CR20]|uniref:PD-(D/E)XK nuclease family protein n=1 Tax=Joostella sp. CR20 TaxID=2804312 RepID=UPI00313EE385
MESFLAQIATKIYQAHKSNLATLTIILPSKRAVVFLKNELLKIADQATIAPQILSIEDFVQQLANLKVATNIQLTFEFYEVYRKLTPENEQEDFYAFTSWAQTILQDFNEIDRYLVDPESFFSHLFNIKEIDQFHWTNLEEKTSLQENYLNFWKRLALYYQSFNEHLSKKGIGYQGMIYREANDNVEYYIQNSTASKHIFIGFNALNNAEKNIIQEFLSSTNAEIYWDVDKTFLENKEHDAGLFLRNYIKEWPYFKTNDFNVISHHFSEEKNINIIGVPKSIGQAKYVGNLLDSIEGTIENTAVVLGNEDLLPAVLNSVPSQITKANITSGFPLNLSPFASFFETLFDVWEKSKEQLWYYQDVIAVLSNPITHALTFSSDKNIEALLDKINEENLIYVTQSDAEHVNPASAKLFLNTKSHTNSDVIENCIQLTLALKKAYSSKQFNNPLFLEYLYRFYEIFNQLKTFNTEYNTITSIQILKKIYIELLVSETIDFRGEPLEGLQIMGMLESRNLDFETVILTSVNEGILPSGKSNNSFIPFDLKRVFGLPTYKEKDSIYSYHFYRLIQRAKNVYLLYNTEPDSLEGGEKSRLLHQLTMLKEPNHQIKEMIASPIIKNNSVSLSVIKKDEAVLNRLKEIAANGFSPSSLTNYIRNPLNFYTQSVLGIKEVEEVEETIAANTLGTIVHDTLETFYKPLEGSYLSLEHIKEMRKNLDKQVQFHYTKTYTDIKNLKGKNLISYHVAKRYIENFLTFEENRLREGKQIKILQIESNTKIPLTIPGIEFPVFLKGKVDRMEEEDGVIRIIDYKTGKVEKNNVEITEWETLGDDYKYSKAFQILCYAYMMQNTTIYNEFEGGIISFKNLKSGLLKFGFKNGKISNQVINLAVLDEFKTQLDQLILEITNKKIPFTEKEIPTHANS